MSGKRKKEKRKKNTYGITKDVRAEAQACGWPRRRVDADVLHVDVDEYKRKRSKKKTYFVDAVVDAWACGRVVCWHVGVQMRMVVDVDECKKKRETYLMDGGRRWWWMRMVTDTDVADSAHVQDLDNFVRVYATTTHY